MKSLHELERSWLQSYNYFLTANEEDGLPVAIVEFSDDRWDLQIKRNTRSFLVLASPEMYGKVATILGNGSMNLSRCTEQSDGMNYLVRSLELNPDVYRKRPHDNELFEACGVEMTKEGWLPDETSFSDLYKVAGYEGAKLCRHDI